MNTLLSLSVAFACGLLLSRLARLVRLPNVTAYLIAGLLIGPSVLGILDETTTSSFAIISQAALGFIAYSIGGEFRIPYLKEIGRAPITITFFQGLMAAVMVDLVLIVCGLFIGIDTPLAIMMGAIAVATAPAATLMVVRQYKAHGKVSGILLPVVAMDDALGLVVFSVSSAVARGLTGGQVTLQSMLLSPLVEIVGSLLLGTVLGFALSFCARGFRSRGNKLALSIAVVFAGVGLCSIDIPLFGATLNFSSLLVCMMIGAIMVNTSKQEAVLMEQCERFTPPLFLLFFVISGATLDLSVIPTVGILGVLYIVTRSFGKWFGAWLGSTVVKADSMVKKYLGLTLLPQAGVAIGMAAMATQQLPQYGAQINAVVLSATLIYELIGPLLTKWALTRAGEIDSEKKPLPAPAK